MKRDELAKYALGASAFMLGGLLAVQAGRFAENLAHAEMVVNSRDITLMTTEFRGGNEVLYVLDNGSGLLLAYVYDSSRKSLKMLEGGRLDIGKSFQQAATNRAAGARPGQRRAR